MVADSMTGSRIRERRLMLGMRQADLARDVGISASYLNLIEHNRRRIGGKLLVALAQALGVEPSLLTEGVEAALVAALREAAADARTPAVELDRVDEFAGRFPGWAEVLTETHGRIGALERTVRSLSDRLTHDPHLAASLHEVLSTAAAIRSTAAILAEPGELEAEWRDRFHKNLDEDAQRLADSSRALVRFLDDSDQGTERRGIPQEEVEAFFTARGFHFPELEARTATAGELADRAAELDSRAARKLAAAALADYEADARDMPLEILQEALARCGLLPGVLAREFGVPVHRVLRRLAALPEEVLGRPTGLVVCDASGSILFRKPVPGFSLPRFGASCPLWPLFTALSQPGVPIRRRVHQQGRAARDSDCFAISWTAQPVAFDSDPVLRAVMLILPSVEAQPSDPAAESRPVGASCRICVRRSCAARREPSILRPAQGGEQVVLD
ncbi:helix-turn-helix domain-containing protein [Epibacterium sp. Ofav1-8]|uniref:helix-turn-helix domain-containing protein n=1 Tax=Epibacterium sp. Ofav1-8 TaxID=2917735 RepID=UPI001EF64124|nr:helix-turn-helix transcriptional regulator [Epibacterium sp. Ofav1-8]MCG7622396.1 helix-turn-helix domain-containing protein [Epibacterium sp. Ofav1-8]